MCDTLTSDPKDCENNKSRCILRSIEYWRLRAIKTSLVWREMAMAKIKRWQVIIHLSQQSTRNPSATIQSAHSPKLWWIVVDSNPLDGYPTSATPASMPKNDGDGKTKSAPSQWVTAMTTYSTTPNHLLYGSGIGDCWGKCQFPSRRDKQCKPLLRSRLFAVFLCPFFYWTKASWEL